MRIWSGACIGLMLATAAGAEDWPQWLGPGQAATWETDGLIERFPEGGLPPRWRTSAGLGYAGPAVADGRVFVFDYLRESGEITNNPGGRARLDGAERLQCLDLGDGSVLWQQSYPAPYEISYPSGPRATPTVDGDRVYTLGAEGRLCCRNVADGALLWDRDLKQSYGVESPLWGFSAAPVIDGERLYVMVGGDGHAVVALHKQSGEELWRALSAVDAGYSAPTVIEAGGVRQLIVWHPTAINGLHPETGAVYWSEELKPDYGMSIMVPRMSGDLLFASGIGNVGAVYRLGSDRPTAALAWKGTASNALYCANSTPVIVDDVIYGCDCRSGALTAARLSDGERLWQTLAPTAGPNERRANHGTAFLVRQGDRFVIFSETGNLILARLTPEKYEEVSRMRLLEPTNECFGRAVVWSHPAFADGCVIARNDREVVCVSLRQPQP